MWVVVYRLTKRSSLIAEGRVYEDKDKAQSAADYRKRHNSEAWIVFFEDPRK